MSKLPFRIVYCSSFEENYPPEELCSVPKDRPPRGWQSKKYQILSVSRFEFLAVLCGFAELSSCVEGGLRRRLCSSTLSLGAGVAQTVCSLSFPCFSNSPFVSRRSRFCTYPQTLVLKFERVVDIKKIQLFSHQSKIATTIDLYVGSNAGGGDDAVPDNMRRLGYLSLDNNQRSNYMARELKSVYINAQGQFLKLVIQNCHINNVNMFEQVGLIAINVVGEVPSNASSSSGAGGGAVIPSALAAPSAAAGVGSGAESSAAIAAAPTTTTTMNANSLSAIQELIQRQVCSIFDHVNE